MIWSIENKERFLFREFSNDDEALVYDRLAGTTHLLDFISSSILQLLTSSVCSKLEIMEYLESMYEFHDKKVLDATVNQHLVGLESHGFIIKMTNE